MQILKAPIENILLIDDDSDDYILFKEALKSISTHYHLSYSKDCEAVLLALEDCKPDLIFLDISLPRKNGFDCLKEIQQSAAHCRIPIVMYSSSGNPKDITAAYGLGATLYFKKPASFEALISALKNILQMAWHTPAAITSKYFKNGKYQSYVAASDT